MTTPEEWLDTVRELASDYQAIGKSADLADRLHRLAQTQDPRRMAEHLHQHGIPEEQWPVLIGLHPWYRDRDNFDINAVVGALLKQVKEGRPRTGGGIAERIADRHGADMVWCKTLNGWLTWSGGRWKTDPNGVAARKLSRDVAKRLMIEVRQAEGEADALDKADDKDAPAAAKRAKALRQFATAADDNGPIEARLALAQTEGLDVEAEEFDAQPKLKAVANGTIELDAKATLREHRRADLLTCIAKASYIPGLRSAEWEAFVEHVIPDREAREFTQRSVGNSFFGENNKRRVNILNGDTSSGKTTFLEVLGFVMGEHASDFQMSLFAAKETESARPDLVRVLSKSFIYASETSDRWSLHGDEIKRLTGHETQSARGLYSNNYLTRKPAFTPWIACNDAPTVIGAGLALWRRLIVIPCGATIDQDQEDPEFAARMSREHGDAILTWIIDGWDKYRELGIDHPPHAINVATMELRNQLSALDIWLDEETDQGDDCESPSRELWNRFDKWCEHGKVKNDDRLSKVAFGRALKQRGFEDGFSGARDGRVRVRTGLRLKRDLDQLT